MHPWQRTLALLRTLARHELAVLISIALLAALAWAFVELADEVIEGDADGFDRKILLAFRNASDPTDPVGPEWVEETARDATALGGVGALCFLTVALSGLLAFQGKYRTVGLLLLSIGGGLIISTALKAAFGRQRPDLVPHGSMVYTSSFPSGHSMMAAVTYLTMGALLMRTDKRPLVRLYLLALAVFLTVSVGVSRVYLGVHWPTDVLAGWTVGAAWALVCWLVARRLQHRGQVEPPTAEPLP